MISDGARKWKVSNLLGALFWDLPCSSSIISTNLSKSGNQRINSKKIPNTAEHYILSYSIEALSQYPNKCCKHLRKFNQFFWCFKKKRKQMWCVAQIWYKLHYLKKVKNNHERVLLLVLKLTLLHGCFSRFLNCKNGTKSRKASQMVFLFFNFMPMSIITKHSCPKYICLSEAS